MLPKAEKQGATAIGLMSGTSADALDIALVDLFPGESGRISLKLKAFKSVPYPVELQTRIKRIAAPNGGNVEEVCKLNAFLGHLFAENVLSFLQEQSLSPDDIDFIGSHGQTVAHFPEEEDWHGIRFRSTLQVGDPSVIAARTGILTVGDFRTADTALGGEGAPLVPIFDYLVFRDEKKSRLLVNIGGIANLTFLPAGAEPGDVIAFDTGPGNVLLDYLARRDFHLPFDRDGQIASRGKIDPGLVEELLQDEYFRRPPPKSTGPEYFLGPFLRRFQDACAARRLSAEDCLASAAELTALSLVRAVHQFLPEQPGEVFLSGGGAENPFLVERIRFHLGVKEMKRSDDLGVPGEAKEAICFALLAYRTLKGEPSNLPRVTGARKAAVLGKICLPPEGNRKPV